MLIKLRKLEEPLHFEAVNEAGRTVQMDAKIPSGGTGLAMGPMETLISALGGCSAIDIVLLLKKFKQDLKDLQVEIEAERDPVNIPSLFIRIHAHYNLYGELEPKKVEKAISLSIDKYCSVSQILKKTVPITYTFTIHPS